MMKFKTFAVAVYSEAGVAEACLTLQDENHVDVPMLLFCGWYGVYYGQLPQQQLDLAKEISSQLTTHVIRPLREARRWMKNRSLATGHPDSDPVNQADYELNWDVLREQIKNTELKAELLLLDALSAKVMEVQGAADTAQLQRNPDDIQFNMTLLVNSDAESGADKQLLELISAACFRVAQMQ